MLEKEPSNKIEWIQHNSGEGISEGRGKEGKMAKFMNRMERQKHCK